MVRERNVYRFDYYALLFFLASFAGWLWEVALHVFTEHRFVNRGIYEGPYLSIYGVGGLLLCLLFRSLQKKPVKVFFYSALVCGVLEYVSGMFLEYKWGLRWWDYSGHFLNTHGRVCLLGTVAFGMGGTLLICLVLPWYGKIYGKIPEKWRNLLWVALTLLFVADGAWCAMHPNMGSGIAY